MQPGIARLHHDALGLSERIMMQCRIATHEETRMRKITQLACNAFLTGRDFTLGNTHVHSDNGVTRMYLHGNLIAELRNGDQPEREIRMTLAGWPTPTTRERLNGLCESLRIAARFYQRDHVQYMDAPGRPDSEREVNPHELVIIRA